MMKSAEEIVAGAATLKAARAALAPFAELYAQISSIQAIIVPPLLIANANLPQTLEIYRYSIYLLLSRTE